ncbi:MAG: class I SAM-dependent methyltransferase [Acholeplasmataceae bacterium]|nr:class I SAM-dependent methyltransferase [Acholeplasmataceae bacterium]
MFAKAYDLLMADVDYEKIYDWMKPYFKNTDLIIDAGCGSGYLLLELLSHGHEAIGIDIDSSMLSIALDKLRNNRLETNLYEHDLRNPFGAEADVIIAMFDVANYFKGVKKVFKNIYQALYEGGRFIFDIYKIEVLKDYKDYIEIEEEPIAYAWKIETQKNLMKHYVEFQGEIDIVTQYVYDLDYYLTILKSLGFTYEVSDGIDPRKHYIVATK